MFNHGLSAEKLKIHMPRRGHKKYAINNLIRCNDRMILYYIENKTKLNTQCIWIG